MQKLKHILEFTLLKTDSINITIFNIAVIVVVFLGTWIITKVITKFFRRFFIKKKIDQSRMTAISQLVGYLLYTLAIVVSLENMGINVSILIAGSAAFLVGLGLGIKQIFSDFVSGLILLFEGTVGIGDVVEIEGNMVGKVREIGLRTSHITTRNNIEVIVPNSMFVENRVVNWSSNRTPTRFLVNVGVAYGSDVKLVRDLLIKSAQNHPKILDKPAPFARFENFGDSSLDFALLFWTLEEFRVENIKSDLRFSIDAAFRENKVTIPFPQRDVHLK